jgi:nitrate/nitrite transport system ATP-binding protein
LPVVTPCKALPRAYAEAAKSFTDDRYLQFSQLHKVYATPKGPLTVVKDFNLTFRKGEFVSCISHSGCGKSTVLTMAARLNDISKGAINRDGMHVEGADPERAVVFQSPSLFPWLTGQENVAIA